MYLYQSSEEHLLRLFEKYVQKVLEFKRINCTELVPVTELNSIESLCCLLNALLTEENGVSIHSDPLYFVLVDYCSRYLCFHVVSLVFQAGLGWFYIYEFICFRYLHLTKNTMLAWLNSGSYFVLFGQYVHQLTRTVVKKWTTFCENLKGSFLLRYVFST